MRSNEPVRIGTATSNPLSDADRCRSSAMNTESEAGSTQSMKLMSKCSRLAMSVGVWPERDGWVMDYVEVQVNVAVGIDADAIGADRRTVVPDGASGPEIEAEAVEGAGDRASADETVSERSLPMRAERIGGVDAAVARPEHRETALTDGEDAPFTERDLPERAERDTACLDECGRGHGCAHRRPSRARTPTPTTSTNWAGCTGLSASSHGST